MSSTNFNQFIYKPMSVFSVPNSQRFNFVVDHKKMERLALLAKLNGTSVATLLRQLIDKYLSEYETS